MSPLIHIGYHKTATSWLQKNLFSGHPNIYMPFSYFETVNNIVFPNALDFSAEKAKSFFSKGMSLVGDEDKIPVLSAERLCGNPHSGGYDSKEIADRIHSIFPDAKILIVVRNQLDMIASTYKQYIMADGTATLEEYLAGAYPERYPSFDYKHFSYDRLASYYISIFGKENVHVMFFEDFCSTPEKFSEGLLSYMGISSDVEYELNYNKVANRSLSDTAYRGLRVLNKFTKNPEMLNFPLINLPGRILFRRMANGVDKVLKLNKKDKYYKHRINQLISGYYTESNKKLSSITGVDLSIKGYK